MAYIVTYDDEYLFDPYIGDSGTIYDASVSDNVSAPAYFDFTIPSTNALYDVIEERSGIVRVYSENTLLFMGEIASIDEDFYGSKAISCVDPRDHLNDVMVRPYSTIDGEQRYVAPSSVDGYFKWLIDCYNDGTMNPKFRFDVGVNQGAYLDQNNFIYRESDSYPTVGSEIQDKILDALGGYLTLTYPNGVPTLNLYADVHEANTQIIDFGVNIIDFSKTTDTGAQYTAIRPEGGTPDKEESESDNLVPGTRDWSEGRGLGYRTSEKYNGLYVLEHAAEANQVTDAGVWTVDRIDSEKQYTLSFYMRTDTPGVSVYSYLYPNAVKSGTSSQGKSTSASDGKILISPGFNWARYWITWTTLDEIDNEIEEFHLIVSRLDHQKDGARVYIAGVKFEESPTATEWSPASGDDGPDPVTIESLGDGVTSIDSDYVKMGDVVYCTSAVQRYGYKEYNWQEGDTLDPQELLEKAVADLKKVVTPKLTIEIKAVDLALFTDGYDHLDVGQVARVRSLPHGIDEYLLVSSMDIDLQDPSQTTYTLGQAFDSLTGEQSSFVKSLNAGINGALDSVSGLTSDMRDNAIKIDQVGNAVTEVGQVANNAQQAANDALSQSGQALDKAEEVGTDVDAMKQEMAEIDAKVDAAEEAANQAAQDAQEAWDKAEQQAQAVADAAEKAQQAADKADQAMSDLSDTANELTGQITQVTTKVNGVEQDVEELSTSVSGAVNTAEGALTAATEAKQTAEGISATATQALTTANSALSKAAEVEITANGLSSQVTAAMDTATDALNKAAEVEVTADGIQADLTKNYVSKTDAANTYATKASLSATAEGLQADISEVTTTAEGALEKANNLEVTAEGLRSDLTETTTTADSALKKANATEVTVNGMKQTLTETTNTANSALSKSTSLETSVNGVKTQVDSVSKTADSALSKASAAQQDITGFKTTVSNTYETKKDADAAMAQEVLDRNSAITQKANQILSEVKANYVDKTTGQTYASKTYVDQREDAILQAVETEYQSKDGMSSYYTKTQVDQQRDQIELGVSQAINDIQVGGRNLLMYTGYDNLDGTSVRGSYAKLSRDTSNSYNGRTSLKLVASAAAVSGAKDAWQKLWSNLTVGDELILSFWAKGSVAAKMWHRMGGGTASGGSTSGSESDASSITTSWKRFEVSLGKVASAGTSGAVEVIYGFSVAGTFYINGMKLEVGNKPTDWSPAPEDTAKELSSLTVSLNGITGKVSDLEGNQSSFQQTINGFEGRLTTAEDNASSAKSTAATANNTANSAKTAATNAQNTANTANTNANTAKTNAQNAVNTANTAKSTADSAKTTATTANNTANTAKSTADSAKSTANTAKSTADTAKSTANAAQDTADGLKGSLTLFNGSFESGTTTGWTYNGANSPYVNDMSPYSGTYKLVFPYSSGGNKNLVNNSYIPVRANQKLRITCALYPDSTEASSSIGFLLSNGNVATVGVSITGGSWHVYTGVVTIPSGATTARARIAWNPDSAGNMRVDSVIVEDVTDAQNAAKTATNYISFSSNGLVVGTNSGGTGQTNLLGNTRMYSGGMEVRNGTTVLARYGASTIELGVNSPSSVIKFCGGAGRIMYTGSRRISIANSSDASYPEIAIDTPGCSFGISDRYQSVNHGNIPNVAWLSAENLCLQRTNQSEVYVPMSQLINLLDNYAHPVGSIIFLKSINNGNYTPNQLGYVGTWKKCAVGLSNSQSPFRALDNGSAGNGAVVWQYDRSNIAAQKWWFDIYPGAYPNSGNRVDVDVWLRTA